jgi:hypothetical protein
MRPMRTSFVCVQVWQHVIISPAALLRCTNSFRFRRTSNAPMNCTALQFVFLGWTAISSSTSEANSPLLKTGQKWIGSMNFIQAAFTLESASQYIWPPSVSRPERDERSHDEGRCIGALANLICFGSHRYYHGTH